MEKGRVSARQSEQETTAEAETRRMDKSGADQMPLYTIWYPFIYPSHRMTGRTICSVYLGVDSYIALNKMPRNLLALITRLD